MKTHNLMSVVGTVVLLLGASTNGPLAADSACQQAQQQIAKMQQAARAIISNARIDRETQYQNEVLDCQKSIGDSAQQCVNKAQTELHSAILDLEKQNNSLDGEAAKATNLLQSGACSSGASIADFGKAIGDIEQGVAQIIAASKSKSSASSVAAPPAVPATGSTPVTRPSSPTQP